MPTIVLAFLSLAASRAVAALRVEDSIEWMVADSDLVARCRIAAIDDDPVDAAAQAFPGRRRLTFEVLETLKGEPAARVDVRIERHQSVEEFIRWRDGGNEARIEFFQRSERSGEPMAAAAAPAYPYHVRNLDWQWRSRAAGPAVASDLTFRDMPEAFEHAVRVAVRDEASAAPAPGELDRSWRPAGVWANRQRAPGSFWIFAPYDSPAGSLTSTSGVAVVVPLDKRIETIAARWFDSGRPASFGDQAVEILQHFRNPANVERLRAALASPSYAASWSTAATLGPQLYWSYPTRRAAFHRLRAWGVDVPRPAIDMPADGYFVVDRGPATAALVVALAAFLTVAYAAHLIRRRARRPSVRAALLDAICVALLGVVMAVWWIDGRRAGIAPEAAMQVGGTRGWAWAHANGLTFLRATAWDPRNPLGASLAVAAFDVAAAPPGRWGLGAVTTSRAFAGFGYTSGTLQSVNGVASPAASVRIPLWSLAALAAVVPVARVAVIARRAGRRRRRLRTGRCVACGYDLRGTDGARCPECGTAGAPA